MPEYLAILRDEAWKLADRAFVQTDWAGFVEMALPGDRPAGVLRYLSRLLVSLGLLDYLWWLPYLFAGSLLGVSLYLLFRPLKKSRSINPFLFVFAGVLFAFFRLWTCGTAVWTDPEPSSPLMHSLGLSIACLLVAGLWKSAPAVSAVVCFVLFPVFGVYPLVAGAVFLAMAFARRRFKAAFCSAVALAAVLMLSQLFLYKGLSWSIMADCASAFRRRFSQPEAIRTTLRMERCAREGDWAGIISIADERKRKGIDFPLRMEIAYRILAQYHLGKLPDDLFKYPIRTFHRSNEADEILMDGYMLYFGYAFLLDARREVFERASMSGMEPGQLRVLGDIALMRREPNLAFRYYAALARCPFRNDFVKRRMGFLQGNDHNGADDISSIAVRSDEMDKHLSNVAEGYRSVSKCVEGVVYESFRMLSSGSTPVVRMLFACSLLDGDERIIATNLPAIESLYSGSAVLPDVIRQAVVEYASSLSPEKRDEFGRTVKANALGDADIRQFMRFAKESSSTSPENLIPQWGETYHFYRHVIVGDVK